MGPEDVNIAVQDAYTNQRTWAAYTVKVLLKLFVYKWMLLCAYFNDGLHVIGEISST